MIGLTIVVEPLVRSYFPGLPPLTWRATIRRPNTRNHYVFGADRAKALQFAFASLAS